MATDDTHLAGKEVQEIPLITEQTWLDDKTTLRCVRAGTRRWK